MKVVDEKIHQEKAVIYAFKNQLWSRSYIMKMFKISRGRLDSILNYFNKYEKTR